MSRKPRDYKAEYARRKAIAASKGTTPAKLRRMVKEGTYTPIRVPTKRVRERIAKESPRLQEMRREAARWSVLHSQRPTSHYSHSMTAKQVVAYHKAYVEYHQDTSVKMGYIHDYLVDEMEFYDEPEYDEVDWYKSD